MKLISSKVCGLLIAVLCLGQIHQTEGYFIDGLLDGLLGTNGILTGLLNAVGSLIKGVLDAIAALLNGLGTNVKAPVKSFMEHVTKALSKSADFSKKLVAFKSNLLPIDQPYTDAIKAMTDENTKRLLDNVKTYLEKIPKTAPNSNCDYILVTGSQQVDTSNYVIHYNQALVDEAYLETVVKNKASESVIVQALFKAAEYGDPDKSDEFLILIRTILKKYTICLGVPASTLTCKMPY